MSAIRLLAKQRQIGDDRGRGRPGQNIISDTAYLPSDILATHEIWLQSWTFLPIDDLRPMRYRIVKKKSSRTKEGNKYIYLIFCKLYLSDKIRWVQNHLKVQMASVLEHKSFYCVHYSLCWARIWLSSSLSQRGLIRQTDSHAVLLYKHEHVLKGTPAIDI